MRHHQFLNNKEPKSRFVDAIGDPFWLRHQVESWNGKQIARWIEGLGDSMNPFTSLIRTHVKNGKHLPLIDNQTLCNMGINGLGARKLIIQAIELLSYFCNEAPRENLQSLTMKVVVSAARLAQTLSCAPERKDKACRKSEIVLILNSITSDISSLVEEVKRLIFWLDRSPFDENELYNEWRNKLSELILSLVEKAVINPQSIFNMSTIMAETSQIIKEMCSSAIIENEDPAILYTAHTENALIKRSNSEINWGINLQSSYRGVHVISEIKEGSPADVCGKIDAGDEILLINDRTVIGWDLVKVAERLGSNVGLKLTLVVNKRPRDAPSVLLRNAPKIITKPLGKMIPGSQATYTGGHEKSFLQGLNYPLNRRRSSTFVNTLQKIEFLRQTEIERLKNNQKNVRKRRASISCSRERKRDYDDQHGRLDWNLMELLGRPEGKETHVVRRARTMRHQPDGYVRSFIDNKLVHEIEEDVVTEQLPCNVLCPAEFASITVVDNAELSDLNIVEPQLTDPDWSAPPNELMGQRFSRVSVAEISGSRFRAPSHLCYNEEALSAGYVQASPSSSSINSACSPAPFKLLASPLLDNSAGSGEDLPSTPTTPYLACGDKIFEGWIRRRKIGRELSENTNKWPKCWMCLRGPNLSMFSNQHSRNPDFTLNIAKCSVSGNVQIKTSKKNVFRVSKSNLDYYFSSYSPQDMKSWIMKISYAIDIYGIPPRGMSKSMTYYKDQESGDETQFHYNTMTGIPSLMSQSQEGHHISGINTLPRSAGALLAGLTSKSKPASPTTVKPKK